MFFVQALDEPPGEAGSPGDDMEVKLTFEGTPSGALTLCVTTAAAGQIAADFLGEDESGLSHERVVEVVCELANMICGSVLSRVESASTFRLASPQFLPAQEGQNGQRDAVDRLAVHTIAISAGTLTAIVETRDPVCPAAEESVF
jgi:CheY-specific phosphatase CheX